MLNNEFCFLAWARLVKGVGVYETNAAARNFVRSLFDHAILPTDLLRSDEQRERRGETFVTRKITLAAARIAQGLQDKLYLGNLDSLRDWGYAKDYVECMWLILQARQPEDYVIATGVQHSVREFAQLAFHYVGIELQWEGEAEHEKGICVSGPDHLDPQYHYL